MNIKKITALILIALVLVAGTITVFADTLFISQNNPFSKTNKKPKITKTQLPINIGQVLAETDEKTEGTPITFNLPTMFSETLDVAGNLTVGADGYIANDLYVNGKK